MPAMKLTPNAAMRARDVSRPHPEHLAEAEAAEVSTAGGSRARFESRDAATEILGWEDRERPERNGGDGRDGRDEIDAVPGGDGRGISHPGNPGYPQARP